MDGRTDYNHSVENMSTLKPVSRVTLGEQVATQLSDQIAQGRWKPGERLPSETELCKALGVGRSTLREALKALAFVGMVQVRPGEGTFVVGESELLIERILANSPLKTDKEIQDVSEARVMLESQSAALAAERADTEGLERLDELMKKMKNSLNSSGKDFAELDLDFHLALAKCANNQVLFELLNAMRGTLQEWASQSQEIPGMQENTFKQHSRILAAIKRKDMEKAQHEMRAHLHNGEKVFALPGRAASQHHA